MDFETVIGEVGSWSIEDRLRLIDELWGTIAVSSESFVLSESHKADLRVRLEAYRDDPKAGSSWDVVEARLRAKSR